MIVVVAITRKQQQPLLQVQRLYKHIMYMHPFLDMERTGVNTLHISLSGGGGSERLFVEQQTKTCRIELQSELAQVFPNVLDYMYLRTKNLPYLHLITTETATPMHALGDYFMILPLARETKQFILKDHRSSVENVRLYYHHAKLLQREDVLGTLASYFMYHTVLVQNTLSDRVVENICQHLSIGITEDPRFIANVIAKLQDVQNGHTRNESVVVSYNIAKFVAANVNVLDYDAFAGLTDPNKLPCVSPNVALQLCAIEVQLRQKEKQNPKDADQDDSETIVLATHEKYNHDKNNNNPRSQQLSSLKMRCIAALGENWHLIDKLQKSNIFHELLSQQPSKFLTDSLVKIHHEQKLAWQCSKEEEAMIQTILRVFIHE